MFLCGETTTIIDVGTTTLELARSLHGRRGLTVEYNQDDARVKRALSPPPGGPSCWPTARSLAGSRSPRSAPLSAIDAVVTDASAAHQPVSEIAAAGAEVIEAKVPDAVEPQ